MTIRFGPAGIPIQCEKNTTLDGVKCCAEIGLTAMEMEFVHGVRMSEASAKKISETAKKLEISLSSHAPYYINLCSKEKPKINNSKRHIIQSAKITSLAGGNITVFHPGFYQKLSPKEAYDQAKSVLKEIVSELKTRKIKIRLGAETVGKKSSFGGLEESIKLSEDIAMVEPCIDFAHIHARGDLRIKTKDDYHKIFTLLEKKLGSYVKRFHCHFSEIEYTEKGEKNHIPLGTKNTPPFKPFMKLLAENGYSGTIICESPKIDLDAIKMMKEYNKIRGK